MISTIDTTSDDIDAQHITNTSCGLIDSVARRLEASTESSPIHLAQSPYAFNERKLGANSINTTVEIAVRLFAPGETTALLGKAVVADIVSSIENGTFLPTLLQFASALNLTYFDSATVNDAYLNPASKRTMLGFLNPDLVVVLAASTAAGSIGATAASSAIPAGDPLSLVFAVQFISLTSSIDGLPPDYSENYAGSLGWANLQFEPPCNRWFCLRTANAPRRNRDEDLRTDAELAQDLLVGNIWFVLSALIVLTIGRRACALLIRMKNRADLKAKEMGAEIKRKAAAAARKSMDRAATMAHVGATTTATHADTEDDLYPELSDRYFERSPGGAAPLPFVPIKWQTSSGGPAVEVNLLLVAQMGLLNSCFTVVGQGSAMKPEIRALAAVVLSLVVAGDILFFRFLKGTLNRLQSEGALEYVLTDHVYEKNRHVYEHAHKQLYQHDEAGNLCRDNRRRKLRAVMDANVFPPVPCEFEVIADEHNNAIYFEHDAQGDPIKVGDTLVPAEPDEHGAYQPSAKPVLTNHEQPVAQNAREVAYSDGTMYYRLYLLLRFNDKTTGAWEANTDEAYFFIEGYGSAFAKFGVYGSLYYFVDLIRKILDCFTLAFARGSTQTGVAAVVQWIFNIVFAFMMPYSDMKSNSNEITQNGGRLLTMMLCAMMSLGLLGAGFVAAVLVLISTIQIYVNIGMGFYAAFHKAFEAYFGLFFEVNVVTGLELSGVPGGLGRELVFKLTPSMVKLATKHYVENLQHLVIAVFAHIRHKILDEFDEALLKAEVLIGRVDPGDLSKSTQDALKDPFDRRLLVCEIIVKDLTAVLLPQIEEIVLPKALKMMSQVGKHELSPPAIKDKVAMASKRILIQTKVLTDPGKILMKLMLHPLQRMLPTFVRAIVRLQSDNLLSPAVENVGTQIAVQVDGRDSKLTSSPPPRTPAESVGVAPVSVSLMMCASELSCNAERAED